jgi:hypothetical protein
MNDTPHIGRLDDEEGFFGDLPRLLLEAASCLFLWLVVSYCFLLLVVAYCFGVCNRALPQLFAPPTPPSIADSSNAPRCVPWQKLRKPTQIFAAENDTLASFGCG